MEEKTNSKNSLIIFLSKSIQAFWGLFIAIKVIIILLVIKFAYGFSQISSGQPINDNLSKLSYLNDKLYIISFLIFLLCSLVFSLWLYNANKNLKAFNNTNFEFTPTLAALSIYIPILFLYWPFKAIKEIWTKTFSEKNKKTYIIWIWWTTFLLSFLIFAILNKISEINSYKNFIIYLSITILAHILTIISAALGIFIVSNVSKEQHLTVGKEYSKEKYRLSSTEFLILLITLGVFSVLSLYYIDTFNIDLYRIFLDITKIAYFFLFLWFICFVFIPKIELIKIFSYLLFTPLILLIIGLTYFYIENGISSNNKLSPVTEENNIKKEIASINENLPRKIDKITELYKVEYSNNSISFFYRLIGENSGEFNFDEKSENAIKFKENLKNRACSNPNIKAYLESNISFRYIYSSSEKVLFIIDINKNECGY